MNTSRHLIPIARPAMGEEEWVALREQPSELAKEDEATPHAAASER
jgi:hypothetical protein